MCLYEGIKTSRLWCCRCVVYHRSLHWAPLRASEYPAWCRLFENVLLLSVSWGNVKGHGTALGQITTDYADEKHNGYSLFPNFDFICFHTNQKQYLDTLHKTKQKRNEPSIMTLIYSSEMSTIQLSYKSQISTKKAKKKILFIKISSIPDEEFSKKAVGCTVSKLEKFYDVLFCLVPRPFF